MSTCVLQSQSMSLHVGAGSVASSPMIAPDVDVWDVIMAGEHERLAAMLAQTSSLVTAVGAEGQTLLHLACDGPDNEECARVLVARGADANAKDVMQRSPLLVACETQAFGSAHLLIAEAGASLSVSDENGMGPSHWLAKHGSAELLALALKHGSRVDAVNSSQQTPLHIAIMHGQLACALVLLDAGARPSAKDAEGRCAMHLAMQFSGGLGACSESTLLLLRLLQLDASLVKESDADNRTPLHWACGKNALPCVRALIKSGADVNATDWAARTPIHWAVLVDASESASELIQSGAHVSHADRDQRTPLHWAADRASEKCLKLLMNAQNGESVDAADWGGYTALHYAARRGAVGCVRTLLSHGASKQLVAMNGELPTDVATDDLTKALLTETVGMKRQRSLSSANSLVLFHVLPDLAKQFYVSWAQGDVSNYLAPAVCVESHPSSPLLRAAMREYPRLTVDDVHVCSSTSKVVVELSSEGARKAKMMHSLCFTDDGLVAEFTPYVCSF